MILTFYVYTGRPIILMMGYLIQVCVPLASDER